MLDTPLTTAVSVTFSLDKKCIYSVAELYLRPHPTGDVTYARFTLSQRQARVKRARKAATVQGYPGVQIHICQNPDVVSNLGKKKAAPSSWAKVSSTAGSICLSLHILIQFCEIDADPDTAVLLFWHDYHSCAPSSRLFDSSNNSHFFHSVEFQFYFKRRGDATTPW